jgi:hypothetical protein
LKEKFWKQLQQANFEDDWNKIVCHSFRKVDPELIAAKTYKTFENTIVHFDLISWRVFTSKHLQTSPIFGNKEEVYQSEAPSEDYQLSH